MHQILSFSNLQRTFLITLHSHMDIEAMTKPYGSTIFLLKHNIGLCGQFDSQNNIKNPELAYRDPQFE